MASMRSSATWAHAASSASTVIWLTTLPSTRFSSTQARCGRVDAEHGRARADQRVERDDRLVRASRRRAAARGGSRWRRAMVEPAGAASSTARMMKSVEPTWSASSHTSWAHSGWAITMPSGCSARKAAMCSGRNRWCTEQWPFHSRKVACLASTSVRPPSSMAWVPHAHVGLVEAHRVAGVATEVLVGEEQHLVAAGPAFGAVAERPVEHGPGVGRRAHGAAVLAHERLERGRRVHVGDRHELVDVGDPGEVSHASSTWSMSAMSAIEQPALRSGRITCWWSPVSTSADSAMKCTPQNTM